MPDASDASVQWGRGHVRHGRVPDWVLDAEIDGRLVSDRAIRLYVVLGRYADEDGDARVGKSKLMARLGCARSTLDAAVADLATVGALDVEPVHRDDGSSGANRYTLHWAETEDSRVAPSDVPVGGSSGGPGPLFEVRPTFEEHTDPPTVPPSGSAPATRPASRPEKVDRRVVTDSEFALAIATLVEFNRQAGTRYASKDFVAKIVMRHREHPSLDTTDHARVIAAALRDPWWSGPPSPSVVYGNAALFEKCVHATAAAESAPGGRALTPDEVAAYGITWGPGTEHDSLAASERAAADPAGYDFDIDPDDVRDDG